jgi:mannose-6-phosphate isomerase-like protein (cupin superfamily)
MDEYVRSKANVVARDWGANCQAWELVSHAELAVVHERVPPGTGEEEHYHARAMQFFFVLEGELLITVRGRQHHLRPHQGLEIPPGERHIVRNVSAETTEFLVIAQPTTSNDRVVSVAAAEP